MAVWILSGFFRAIPDEVYRAAIIDGRTPFQAFREVKRLHEEGDSTYLYFTHDQIEALTMADQMVVLESGIVQQVALPREVHERPANMFVAGFIGSPRINLVRPGTLRIPEALTAGLREVVVGVRPEDIFVGGGAPPEGAVPGRVYVAEPVGASTWVTLEIAGERVKGHANADFIPRSGAQAWARLALDRVLFFDPRITKRVEA